MRVFQSFYGRPPTAAEFAGFASADAAVLGTGFAREFASLTNDALVVRVLANMDITAQSVNAAALDILRSALVQYFGLYGSAARGQIVSNLARLLAGLEADGVWGTAARAFNSKVSAAANNLGELVIAPSTAAFVSRSGTGFSLNGRPFLVTGVNAAQVIANTDRSGMRNTLALARQLGANTVRIYAGSEIGSLDGSVRTLGLNKGSNPYFQYWDPASSSVKFNLAASNGLPVLDEVITTAGELGLKVVVALADNWDFFYGGVNQYVTWYGGTRHGEFFTNARMRNAYKQWVTQLLGRTNTRSGVRYADDPTIMAWELLNEASCYGGDGWPADGCTSQQIEAWIGEMAAHVKSIDSRHLVAVGDQGHYGTRDDAAMGWPYRSTNEPDFDVVLRNPNIDFGTYHLYPYENPNGNGSLTPAQYGVRFIADREASARAAGKPVLMEEFGARDVRLHKEILDTFIGKLNAESGAGFVFWAVGGRFDNGQTVWDSQGYTIYPDSASGDLLRSWIASFLAR